MNLLTQAIFSGVMSGAVYALLALGLIAAYRTSHILNLAHGESYAVAGVACALLSAWGMPLAAAILFALALAVALPVALDRFVLQPRSGWSSSALILVTLGVAFLSRGLLYVAVGIDPVSFPRLVSGPPLFLLGGAMPRQGLLLIVLGFAAAAGVCIFLLRTPLGRQLQACAENPDAAQLLGVNVGRARATSFAFAGLLGGLAAVLLIPLTAVDFQAGLGMTLRGFIAAALGGMTPLYGIVAALALGLFEAFVTAYVGALLQDPIVFLVLIGTAIWQSRNIRFGGQFRA